MYLEEMDNRYQPYLVRNNNRKTPWIRMIQMYIGTYEFSKRWQDIIAKVSFEAVKQLAITVHQFIQHPSSSNVPVDRGRYFAKKTKMPRDVTILPS